MQAIESARTGSGAVRRRLGGAPGYLIAGAVSALLGRPVDADAAPASADAADSGLQEVIVTAQRREQNLQDVGISVTALDPRTLTDLDIRDTTQIVRAVPGLRVNSYSPTSVVFNIRGVSQNDYGDQQEPPIAVYQDDSYSSSINLTSFPMFDVARVEVDRGPQGTLFGRNANGGAIQVISNRPTRSLESYASVSAGSYNDLLTEAAVSGPLTDTLQFRISGMRDHDHGWLESVYGQPSLASNDHWATRIQLAWQPMEGTNVLLLGRYMRAPWERQAGMYSLEPACPNSQIQGDYLPPNQTCPYWAGFIGGTPGLPVPGTATGQPGPGTTATGYRNDAITPSRGGDPWKQAALSPNYVNRAIKGTTLRIDTRLAALTLTSITDFQSANKLYIEDTDGTPDLGAAFFQDNAQKQYSQEFRLSGALGAHQWVGGLYAMKIDGRYSGSFPSPFYGYLPLANFHQGTRSWAAFTQDEWKLSERFTLIAGLRYWHDERLADYFISEPGTGVAVTFNPHLVTATINGTTAPLAGLDVNPADADRSFSGVTARLELDWHLDADTLLYGSFNRGSKSGGFTLPLGTPFPGAQVAFLNGIPYRPEVLNAFELGIKSRPLPNTTLNVSTYYYDYRNYQSFSQLSQDATIVNVNAEAAGLEAELASRPLRGLTLQMGIASEVSKVKHLLLPDLVSYVDHDLPQTPKFTGNALVRYEQTLSRGSVYVQSDLYYTARFCYTALCAPVERERPYALTGARLGYAGANDRWELAAFVENLTNRVYWVYRYDNSPFTGTVADVPGRPRTWGVSGTWRFAAR